jgi:hypothetical protein
MEADEAFVAAGSLTWVANASQNYLNRGGFMQSSGSNGDSYAFSFSIRSGTYLLKCLGVTSTDSGLLDIYFDNTKVDTIDFYSGSTVFNVIKTSTSLVVSTSGRYKLTLTINGKNASSSSFIIRMNKLWLLPSGGD